MKDILNNYVIRTKNRQVQIQGFPRWNANHRGRCQSNFRPTFSEKSMKMKKMMLRRLMFAC